jgi:uncharacterized short protein YbdD (DUF466 family)
MKALKIPPMLKILHPMMSDHEYECNRDNPSFLSKICLVCTECYLELTASLSASGKQPETYYNMLIGDPDYDLALMHSTKGMGPLRPDRIRERMKTTMDDIKDKKDFVKYHDKTFKEFMEEFLIEREDQEYTAEGDLDERGGLRTSSSVRGPMKKMKRMANTNSMTALRLLKVKRYHYAKQRRGSQQSDVSSNSGGSPQSPLPFEKSLSIRDDLSSVMIYYRFFDL